MAGEIIVTMLDAGVILFTCDGMRSDTVEMSTAITVAFKCCVQIIAFTDSKDA